MTVSQLNKSSCITSLEEMIRFPVSTDCFNNKIVINKLDCLLYLPATRAYLIYLQNIMLSRIVYFKVEMYRTKFLEFQNFLFFKFILTLNCQTMTFIKRKHTMTCAINTNKALLVLMPIYTLHNRTGLAFTPSHFSNVVWFFCLYFICWLWHGSC